MVSVNPFGDGCGTDADLLCDVAVGICALEIKSQGVVVLLFFCNFHISY